MPTAPTRDSGAFIESFEIAPTSSGPLDGLRFATKDLLDVAGRRTGCGNPDWLATHPPARVSAICVEQLLAAGGTCVGKTLCDELAFSLIGENFFYGTPLNPAAPERVPGGSSSGSAAAVACGLADFALGTDTGGSIRIPASNCGLWGLRPTQGAVSVAGVMPFAPSFDTVGVLAASSRVLQQAMNVLFGDARPRPGPAAGDSQATVDEPTNIHLVAEAFELANPEVRKALEAPMEALRARFTSARFQTSSLGALCGDVLAADLAHWRDVFRLVRGAEVDCCLGGWIDAVRPEFGPAIAASFELVRELDRTQLGAAIQRRERLSRTLQNALGPRDLLCIPTAPTIAPRKGAADHDRHGDYYSRTIALTSLAGIARLPQLSLPLANVVGVPAGLSLIAAHGQDAWLLDLANVSAELGER